MKIKRIYKCDNDELVIEGFSENLTMQQIEQIPPMLGFESFPNYLFECCNLAINQHTGNCCDFPATDHIDKLFLDEDENIQVDTNWDHKLMPASVIYNKNNKIKDDLIDAELDLQSPDTIKIYKAFRSKEKLKKGVDANATNDDIKKVYEEALANLDDRVTNGEPDKPVIRQKLEAKIASFE